MVSINDYPFLSSRDPESYKGDYGHALLVAGSYGKMGAAVLAARACLRAGVGLLTVHTPRCGVEILQTAVPEAMVMTFRRLYWNFCSAGLRAADWFLTPTPRISWHSTQNRSIWPRVQS